MLVSFIAGFYEGTYTDSRLYCAACGALRRARLGSSPVLSLAERADMGVTGSKSRGAQRRTSTCPFKDIIIHYIRKFKRSMKCTVWRVTPFRARCQKSIEWLGFSYLTGSWRSLIKSSTSKLCVQ